MNIHKTHFLLLIMLCMSTAVSSQTIVNRDWVEVAGIPDPLSISTSCIDYQNNIITASSELVTGQDANISVIKYDVDGNILWQNYFNGVSNGKDYATSVKTDGSGNVYVIGTTYNTVSNYDYVFIKYDASGGLVWQKIFNGTGNSIDIPTALILDNNNDIYVTGASIGVSSLSDYATIKYSGSGTQLWVSLYDFALGYEAPVGMSLDPSTNNIYVTGASASTSASTNWDFATVEYNPSGTPIQINRSATPGTALDKPTAICRDNSGNIYVTGTAWNSVNSSYDIKIVKLNSSLTPQWVVSYDAQGLTDQANSIDVDNSGNVFIAGFVGTSSDNNIIVLKYNSSGLLVWENEFSNPGTVGDDEGNQIHVDANGNAYLTGTYDVNGNKNFISMKLSPDGGVEWQEIFDGGGSGDDVATSIDIDADGNVIVSGITDDGSTNRNTTIRYNNISVDLNNIGTLTDGTKYIKNEVIVKFDPSIINPLFSDNIDLQYAPVENVLPSSLISLIEQALGLESPSNLVLIKVYDWMTLSDSISIARDGSQFVMNKLWSTYRLLLPSSVDEETATSSLNGLSDSIEFASLNKIFNAGNIPNDPYVGSQTGLIPTVTTPSADINADGAWDIETGRPFVRVGIIDKGSVNYAHEDFGGGTATTSIVVDGEDFDTHVPIASITTFGWHATACAGIIGALRNNSIGIAGIAGGNGQPNSGVSLVSLGGGLSTAAISNAIAKGSSFTYAGGLGYHCDILNNSYFGPSSEPTIEQSVDLAFNNHCIFAACRGNADPSASTANTTSKSFPACYMPPWVINVGASGNNGQLKLAGGNGDGLNKSKYDNGVDVIAPGSTDIVVTTNYDDADPGGVTDGLGSTNHIFSADPHYTLFNATSAACPHVVGLASLMKSHHAYGIGNYPNDLDDGDVQHLIKRYANDVGGEGQTKVGSGLINAQATMEHIDLNHGYWVQHGISSVGGSMTYSETTISSNQQFVIPYSMYSIAAATYVGDLIEHAYTYTFQLPSFASGNAQIIDAWMKHPKIGISGSNPVSDELTANLTYSLVGNTVTANVVTYTRVVEHSISGATINRNIPPYSNPSNTSNNFTCIPSFLFYDPSIITSTNNLTFDNSLFSIYPNPATDKVNIAFNSKGLEKINIKLYDMLGQRLDEKEFIPTTGHNNVEFLTGSLPSGLYSIVISNNKSLATSKLLINH